MTLREDQIQRYARHVLLREVGGKGQERLLAARVRVAGPDGAGGLETALVYLAAAGVGTLGVDGIADGLRARLAGINPDVAVVTESEGGWDLTLALGDGPQALAASDAAVAGGGTVVLVGARGDGLVVAWGRAGEGCARCVRQEPWRPDPALAALAGAWGASEVLLGVLGQAQDRGGHEVEVAASGATGEPRAIAGDVAGAVAGSGDSGCPSCGAGAPWR